MAMRKCTTVRSARPGVYDRALEALKLAKERGFRVTINCTLFNNADPARVAAFFDSVAALGIEGITVSPGYAYERAPDQQHFLNREKTKTLFRQIFALGKGGKAWPFFQSKLFLDFLAGNRTYQCTPWGNPTRTVFGWQRPCYLLGEGYAASFKELMEETNWDSYGTGNYEKCADCMVHCGFEATAVEDAFNHPLRALGVALRGIRVEGPMAPDIPLDLQRPAELRLQPARRAKTRGNRRNREVRQSIFRLRNSAAKAARASRAVRSNCGIWRGSRKIEPRDRTETQASHPVSSPPGRRAAIAGRAGSATTRKAAKGRLWAAATRAAMWDSISAACAPVLLCRARFSARPAPARRLRRCRRSSRRRARRKAAATTPDRRNSACQSSAMTARATSLSPAQGPAPDRPRRQN